jgi:hypothetical protein
MLDFFNGSGIGQGYRVPWDKLDLTDPEKPRLLCALADLETLKRA